VTETMLMIGTRKGLLMARSRDRRSCWELSTLQFPMNAVYATAIDTRSTVPRVFASMMSEHWGPSLAYSDDLGEHWTEPARSPVAFPEFTETSLERVWQIQPGPPAEPDVIYVGTQPSALFRSENRGIGFEIVRPLWDHPHRPQWDAGYGGQAIHSILPHPADPDRVLVAMSTGGVYRTEDGGDTWAPANQGIRVSFLPDPYPEFGQCVHKITAHPDRPDRVYLQNHGGVPQRRLGRPVGIDRWGPARRLRLPGRGAPAPPGHPVRVPAGSGRAPGAARRGLPGVPQR
jgi:hypothetical protein